MRLSNASCALHNTQLPGLRAFDDLAAINNEYVHCSISVFLNISVLSG